MRLEMNCRDSPIKILSFDLGSSGSLVEGTSPLFNASESNVLVLTATQGASYTIASVSMETYNCKSVAIYMYNDSGRRRYRDRVS